MGQLALAWALARQPDLVPVVGAKTRVQLSDSLVALDKPLSAADVTALETLVPMGAVVGDRYPAQAMQTLDSEK